MKLEEIIRANPSYRILSKTKLRQVLTMHDIPKKDIDGYLKGDELHQIYAKIKFKPKLRITAEPYSFQIDIIQLPRYRSYNRGISKMFFAIEVTSRKAFAYPLKKASMSDVIHVYKQFLQDVGDGPIAHVTGDDFFNHKEFIEINNDHAIIVHTDIAKQDHMTKVGNKLGIVDRATRTIKQLIQKYMLDNDTLVWTKFLPKIIELYNNTPHSSLKGSTPNEVYDDYDYMMAMYQANKKHNQLEFDKAYFTIGDQVRVMLGKEGFDKEKQTFSTKVYYVAERVGYRFRLVDENGKDVKRLYRPSELLKVDEVTRRVSDKLDKAVVKHKQKTHQARALKELQ